MIHGLYNLQDLNIFHEDYSPPAPPPSMTVI